MVGFSYNLNNGLVGIGADNSQARIDNVAVQVLPPEITMEDTDDFSDGIANLFTGSINGQWQVTGSGEATRYEGVPTVGGDVAFSATSLEIGSYYLVQVQTTFSTDAFGGIIFDQYSPSDYKFVALSAVTSEVVIGHNTGHKGLVIDASVSREILTDIDYELTVALKGRTVSILVDGQAVLGHAFNALVVDGDFGLFTRDGVSSFDVITISTDDPAFKQSSQVLVSVDDATVIEGESGSAPIAVTFTLSEAAEEPVTVQYVTVDGSATAGEDYQYTSAYKLHPKVSCLRLFRQAARLPCSLARFRAGIRIDINNAMIAITTKSSIKGSPFFGWYHNKESRTLLLMLD